MDRPVDACYDCWEPVIDRDHLTPVRLRWLWELEGRVAEETLVCKSCMGSIILSGRLGMGLEVATPNEYLRASNGARLRITDDGVVEDKPGWYAGAVVVGQEPEPDE